jgi:hypothetical protein
LHAGVVARKTLTNPYLTLSQVLDLQRDALVAAGVKPRNLYEDQASYPSVGRRGLRWYWLWSLGR